MSATALSRTSFYNWSAFGFVFTGLAISGIPGWSRLVFLFVAILAALTASDLLMRRASLGKWILLPLGFVLCAVIEGIVRYPASHDALVRLLGTWAGALLVGDAIRRGVPVRIAINAMLCASIANALAAIAGFDAYYTYTATAEQQGYTSILDRRSGLVGNANLMAIQAVIPLFAALLWGRGLSKFLLALGVACALYAIFSTGSRKLLVFLFFLVSAALLRLPGPKRWILLGAASMLALALALFFLGTGAGADLEGASRNVLAIDRVFEALEGRDNSFFLRMWMIEVAQGLFAQRPILGGGLGYFAEVGGFGAYAHNNFWELAVAGGLVLLVSYYILHFLIVFRLIRKSVRGSAEHSIGLILVVALLANDFGMVTYDEKIIVLMLVLLLVWVFAPNSVMAPLSRASTQVSQR